MEFNNEKLNIIFPFHVLADEALNIINFGSALKKLLPAIERKNELRDFLELKAPFIPFTYDDIVQKENKLFLFSVKGKELQLKAQVLGFNDSVLFILSPVISDLAILKEIGMTLKDFAIYDSITDTLFLLNAQKMALKESKDFYSQLLETNKELEKVNKEIAEINEHLEQKVVERTQEIQKTLTDLKATQAQLIQSEKMASLGELTAGIAHEIQNPLNFVNNFSEVNQELLAEMKYGIDNGQVDEAKSIAKEIIANEQRINYHGKRADAIVKNMLQHSRSSSSKKEPTDINKLAEEYLRLSYHGFRAKDKSFDAEIPIAIRTEFDESIGKINIVPQDIGRVLLNLYNNAFYACAERSRSAVDEKKKSGIENYEPTVLVGTKNDGDKILISVNDNGNGIPQKVLDKIFQPFFTTKPTGQGTGLGLSLSFDIIKAHGGEIKVETKASEGSEFIVQLPVV